MIDDTFLDGLAEIAGTSVGKTLGMVIRPTFIAAPGKVFVWSDWSAIEARVLPWLAASPGAEKVLDIFRQNDADPSLPDIYKITAGELLLKPATEVTKTERQSHGKVPTLSLGFGGGLGALQKMAVNYHVHLDDEVGGAMVKSWRERNAWAPEFWGTFRTDRHGEVTAYSGLWGAANMAIRNPNTAYEAGRVAYLFDPDYLGGTLFCALPCGRLLTYPDCRWRDRVVKDKVTGEEEIKSALWFRKGYGWSALWHGKLCLAGDTLVVTARGPVRLDQVQPWDLLWDGEAWVVHDGLIRQGNKFTVPVDGVHMTPDHEVLTNEGWIAAAHLAGHDRAGVRLPDGFGAWPYSEAQRTNALAGALQMRDGEAGAGRRLATSEPKTVANVVRLRNKIADRCGTDDARYDEASGVLGLALDARPLQAADTSGVEELRGTGHHSVQALGNLREVLAGHGADLRGRVDARAGEQQSRILAAQLQMGDVLRAGPQSAELEAVYDLINAGPRRRFTVLGNTGPLVVHNCENVTQAAAGSIMRETLVALDPEYATLPEIAGQPEWMPVIGHTHDEIVTEPEDGVDADDAEVILKEVMETPTAWRADLPLVAEITRNEFYTKAEM